ncbi:hypothetical protein ANANG_G00148020 [Anguilla anguilla]|uniref:C2H2-type domain-containing protein n=1 Tax=Anguilla anguilla TaxID=7936 RepID=A0A9D3MC35_ANGAN|nr:hypothetical protein ANANG_G00148020 [Anguilla anguilla]
MKRSCRPPRPRCSRAGAGRGPGGGLGFGALERALCSSQDPGAAQSWTCSCSTAGRPAGRGRRGGPCLAPAEDPASQVASSFRCHACKGKFRTAGELSRHVRILHNPYKCSMCAFSASQEEALAAHLQESHAPESPGPAPGPAPLPLPCPRSAATPADSASRSPGF